MFTLLNRYKIAEFGKNDVFEVAVTWCWLNSNHRRWCVSIWLDLVLLHVFLMKLCSGVDWRNHANLFHTHALIFGKQHTKTQEWSIVTIKLRLENHLLVDENHYISMISDNTAFKHASFCMIQLQSKWRLNGDFCVKFQSHRWERSNGWINLTAIIVTRRNLQENQFRCVSKCLVELVAATSHDQCLKAITRSTFWELAKKNLNSNTSWNFCFWT